MERKISLLKEEDQLVMTRSIKEGEVREEAGLPIVLKPGAGGQIVSGQEPAVGSQQTQHPACPPSLPLPSSTSLTQICPEQEVKTEVTFFPWDSTMGFISEAANLLLLRVMAWRQMVPNNARFLALDTEGKLCYSTYVRGLPGQGSWPEGKLEGAWRTLGWEKRQLWSGSVEGMEIKPGSRGGTSRGRRDDHVWDRWSE